VPTGRRGGEDAAASVLQGSALFQRKWQAHGVAYSIDRLPRIRRAVLLRWSDRRNEVAGTDEELGHRDSLGRPEAAL
jgi:hypothetical protein